MSPGSPKRARAPTPPTLEASATDARYSIRVASRLTAIESDTLRMWERRYGFPQPQRASGGSRLYSQADVEVLKLVRRGLDQGYRPGEIVGKSSEELSHLLLLMSAAVAPVATALPTRATLLATLLQGDPTTLRAELYTAAMALGAKRFVTEIAHPLSVQVGALWAEGKVEVRHEHLLSECLSAQLSVLRFAYEDRAGAPRVLLATLSNERHALGLEMVAVYLAAERVTPLLLGADTPREQILEAARSYSADAVALLVTEASDAKETVRHVKWLLGELPRRGAVWIGGRGGPDLPIRDEALRLVPTWDDLDAAIAALVARVGATS